MAGTLLSLRTPGLRMGWGLGRACWASLGVCGEKWEPSGPMGAKGWEVTAGGFHIVSATAEQPVGIIGLPHSLWRWVISMAASVCTPSLLRGPRLCSRCWGQESQPGAPSFCSFWGDRAPPAATQIGSSSKLRPRLPRLCPGAQQPLVSGHSPQPRRMSARVTRRGQATQAAGSRAGLGLHTSVPQRHLLFPGNTPTKVCSAPASLAASAPWSCSARGSLLHWFPKPLAESHLVLSTGREGLSRAASDSLQRAAASSRMTGAAPGPGGLR